MTRILVVHGPNLNLLGRREPEIYGTTTLDTINEQLRDAAREAGVEVEILQSNHEGEIVDFLNQGLGRVDGLILNAAAYTHYSVAIRDAVTALGVPSVEVHLTNIHAREGFRKRSLMAPVVTGQVVGLGAYGYVLALQGLLHFLAGKGCKTS